MKDLMELFLIFFKIGAFTFGGGYTMLPILQKEIVEKRHWATDEEIMDYYAISQCTPGIIAVNTSIFVGYKVKKVNGGIACALGVITPSIIIILIIASFLTNIMDYEIVQNAFMGIRVAVCALVVQAGWNLFKKGVIDWKTGVIFVGVMAILLLLDISIIIVVVLAGIVGIAFQWNLLNESRR